MILFREVFLSAIEYFDTFDDFILFRMMVFASCSYWLRFRCGDLFGARSDDVSFLGDDLLQPEIFISKKFGKVKNFLTSLKSVKLTFSSACSDPE